tara:strand:- start:290 stop:574 length:285 start_codon:yes stop_codon:yes gene_type:complete
MGQDLGNTNGYGSGDLVNIIRKKCREADLLAARFYKLAAGDRGRAARDWEQKVKEAADLIKLYTSDAQKCRKDLASNKAYLSKRRKNVENVTKM